jgi:hypothetical protein
MSDIVDKNVFLVLMKLDLEENNPLGTPRPGASGLPRMEANGKYALIAALLDPSQQTTRTPLTPILFSSPERKAIYNRIIDRFEGLIERYYDSTAGFLSDPSQLDSRQQESVYTEIRGIGRDIFDLIPNKSPICSWFNGLFGDPEQQDTKAKRVEEQHLTIITNDFNIPWYWMRVGGSDRLLCEVCSLGMLQLANRNAMESDPDFDQLPGLNRNAPLRALLINGSGESDLPFVDKGLRSLTNFLTKGKESRRRLRPFEVDSAESVASLLSLKRAHPKVQRRALYRLFHYSGHWNYENRELLIGGEALELDEIKDFVDSAVLALDGCSSSQGLQAWSEIENLTGKLLNLGALGCVVTTLPVKDDPIVSKVFWEALYSELLAESAPTTLGQALVKARSTLKLHFAKLGSPNPVWAFYQLIGNPSVRLVDESSGRE